MMHVISRMEVIFFMLRVFSLNAVINYELARITLGNTSTRFDFVCNFVKYINENGYVVANCKLISSQFSEKINFSITLRTTAVSSLTKMPKNDIFYKIMGSFRGSINEMCS